MSLLRLAVRIAAVAAIKNRTFAGSAVEDSAIPPLDMLAKDQPRPFIAVYTDDSEVEGESQRGLFGSAGKFDLVFEIGITAQMQFEFEDGAIKDAPGKPQTDAQMEITLDLIERQIKSALSDPSNEWGEVWRSFVSQVLEVKSLRGANAADGVRFAGRQLALSIKPFAEPPCGQAPTGIWVMLLAKLRAASNLGYHAIADLIETAITSTAPLENWQTQLAQLAMTNSEADAMQLTLGLDGATDETTIQETSYSATPVTP
jgi:hypothetical protein